MKHRTSSKSQTLPVWSLSDPQDPPRGPYIASLPGERAPLYRLDLPDSLRETARQQVARSELESVLQRGIEGLEFRVGQLGGQGAAVVVDHALAVDARTRLNGRHPPRALLPDYLTLPALPDAWVIHVEDGRVIARLGPKDGFAAPLPAALLQLGTALRGSDLPTRVHVTGPVPPGLSALLTAHDLTPSTEPVDPWAPGPDELAFNLLRDPAADLREMRQVVRRWRVPMVAMFAGLAALAAALWIETGSLRERAQTIRAASVQVARAAFIPNGPILDLRQQVGRVIAARQEASARTERTGAVDLVFFASEVLTNRAVPVSQLQVTRRGAVRLDVSLPDFAALESLVAELNGPAARARVVTSAVNPQSGVTAELELTGVQ